MADQLSNTEIQQLNAFSGFLSFKYTWAFKKFINCAQKVLLLIYGNQGGKTSGTAFNYVLRILGYHPIPEKNVVYYECENGHTVSPYKMPTDSICLKCHKDLKLHKRSSRVFRFCSQTLPGQSANTDEEGHSAEVKNTQYPEFKKWLPPSLIKKDITARNASMVIKDIYGGPDILVEFISYNQSTQSTAGVQRLSIWCDESPTVEFYEEQLPRLIAEDGDIIFTYTPVDRSSWLFDEFYQKAEIYYRSKAVCDYLAAEGTEVPAEEKIDTSYSIAVIMAATDDNPTLKISAIDAMFNHIDDPAVISIRRYGIFKQLSGRIFKDFDYNAHVIDANKWFPEGMPYDWVHARGIDFHPQTPWACGLIALSSTNEAFIWGELNISPERYTTREIAHELAIKSRDYKFRLSLVDPLSQATKKDNVTIKDDLNTEFRRLKAEGIGTGGYWQSWDTKGEKGRDAIRERLKNSLEVKYPYNNKVIKDGKIIHLPTLWILSSCPLAAKFMRNWRWMEWADARSYMTKDAKNQPEQKWSHMNMVWEAIFKESSFRPPMAYRAIGETRADYFRRH